MGLLLPSSYRNPLAYPAGVAPGFDPSHVAAPGTRFSAVASGLWNVIVPGPIAVTPGNATNSITSLGPVRNFNSANRDQISGMPAVADTFATIAAIGVLNSVPPGGNTFNIFQSSHADPGGLSLSFTSLLNIQLSEHPGYGGWTSTIISFGIGVPFFVVGSQGASRSIVLVKNLLTGEVLTEVAATGTAQTASTGTYDLGTNFYNAPSGHSLAALMYAGAICSLSQMRMWAADPWSFWYPPQRTRSYSYQVAAQGIAFDAASNSGYQTAQSTYSWSHTCTGSDRYLTVGISMLSVAGSSVSSITYNGVAMLLIDAKASVSGAVRAELWGLVAPASGSNTIAVTLSAALDSAGGAVSFAGVHQTSPYEGANDASATNVGAADATVNVTTVANNDWCVDVVATDDTAITVGALQTSRNNVTGTLGSGAMSTEGPETPAGAFTMSWTNVDALKTWSIVSVALRPVQASALGAIYTQLERGIRGLYRGLFTGNYH